MTQDWQEDWPRRTARQIVILPTDLTLSFERLMFLGKSHFACCPVSSLQLAQSCGWMTDWRKTRGSRELIGQREREGCGRRLWMRFSPILPLWLDVIFIHLCFFLTFSNSILLPLRHSKPLKQLRHFPGAQQPPNVTFFQQHLNHHKSQGPRIKKYSSCHKEMQV